MGWKEWPAWLKGGVIGLIVLIILWFLGLVTPTSEFGNVFVWIMTGIGLPAFKLIGFWVQEYGKNSFIELFSYVVYYFLLGAIIGWIVGKIKRK